MKEGDEREDSVFCHCGGFHVGSCLYVTVFTFYTNNTAQSTPFNPIQPLLMQPPNPHQAQRRQSAAPPRLPPMAPPGLPLFAHKDVFSQPGSYKHSVPSPKTVYAAQPSRQGQFSSYRSQESSNSSKSSIYDAAYGVQGGLRESTRVNIRASAPPRQVSATLDWPGDMKSPKEPDLVTPKEQYTPTVEVRDGVDSQFEDLLVCPVICYTAAHQ